MTEIQQKMLDEILEAETGLTGWEMDFIESLDKIRDCPLTEKQIDILIKINSKVLR